MKPRWLIICICYGMTMILAAFVHSLSHAEMVTLRENRQARNGGAAKI